MICPDLQQLLVCRDLLTDSLIQTLQSLQQSPESESLQSRLAAQLIEKLNNWDFQETCCQPI